MRPEVSDKVNYGRFVFGSGEVSWLSVRSQFCSDAEDRKRKKERKENRLI